jgi:parvulin-like peptidyl-prolyl isomerase
MIVKKNIKLIIFLTLILNVYLFAQDEYQVLARVGQNKITLEEFKNRFEFMPHLNYSNQNIDSLKKEFLLSLIAEKLWALEADELSIDTLENVRYSLKTLENLFVRDELYKKEVESKIDVTDQEIKNDFAKIKKLLNINIVSSNDSEKIWGFFNEIKQSSNYDSLLIAYNLKSSPYKVKYGSIENDLVENVIYSLKINQTTEPIKIDDLWLMFKLISDDPNPSTINLSPDQIKNIITEKLKSKEAQKIGNEFINNLLADKSITADRKLFNLLADKFTQHFDNHKIDSTSLVNNEIQINEADILKVLKSIDLKDLKSNFIVLESRPATIEDFLYYLIYQKVYYNFKDRIKFKRRLSAMIRNYIEDETLAREGYKLGLDKLSSVNNDLKVWRDYYLAEVLMNSYTDSIKISEVEIQTPRSKIEKKDTSVLQINIVEILTDNLDDIDSVIAGLKSGKDMKVLAKIYSKRKWTKASSGEWGFFNPSGAGEIGRIAASLKVGEIYGPLKTPDGYSIFKLIDRRQTKVKTENPEEAESDNILKMKIALTKMDKIINSKTAAFANKFEIKFYEEILNRIQVSELNTFTYRLIGFGGKIAAFPITTPMYEWYKTYLNQKQIP